MIDAHLHLDQYPVERVESLIEEWEAAGVEKIVAVSTNLASAYRILEWKAKYPQFIYAAVGYHPEQELPATQELNEILALLKKEREAIAAVGEVGLPYYTLARRKASLEAYLELLEIFVQQAKEKNLPLILHGVHDQAPLVLNLLLKYHIDKAHFHWLKASSSVVQEIIAAGYYISVTPEVCYRERDQELVQAVPLNNLLLETDGPWPYADKFAKRTTTPLMIQEVAEMVAKLKEVEVPVLLKQCQQNIENLLGKI